MLLWTLLILGGLCGLFCVASLVGRFCKGPMPTQTPPPIEIERTRRAL